MKALHPWQKGILIPVLAACGGWVANAVAGPERHLAWTGRPPAEVSLAMPASAPPQPSGTAALPAGTDKPAAPGPAPMPVPVPPPGARKTESARSATPGPVPTAPTPAAGAPASPIPDGPGREIDSAEAFQAFQQGALFLDARRSSDFRAGHIRGAHSAPVWQSDLEEKLTVFEALSGAQATSTLVLYCGGGDCRDSHLLAGKLWQRGFRKLLIYRDGYPDWVKQGRPTATGEAK